MDESSLEYSGSSQSVALGAVAGRVGSPAGSGSSSSVAVRKESKPRKERAGSFSRELSARRAEHGTPPRTPFSMELEPSQQSMTETATGSQPHTIAQVFAARQGDRMQHNQHFEHHEQQDMRRLDVNSQVLQQFDQRQVHIHQTQDHDVVLEAARHVVAANERVTAVEAEALQAVLQARGQAEAVAQEARTQSEILSVRFAAEIQAAQVRENQLLEQLEGLRQELARRAVEERRQPEEQPRSPVAQPQPTSLEIPSQSPNGTGNPSNRDVLLRLAHLERDFAQRLSHLEGEHQALRDVVQDLWMVQETWNQWPGYETPRANSTAPEPQPDAVHRIDTGTDEDEHR